MQVVRIVLRGCDAVDAVQDVAQAGLRIERGDLAVLVLVQGRDDGKVDARCPLCYGGTRRDNSYPAAAVAQGRRLRLAHVERVSAVGHEERQVLVRCMEGSVVLEAVEVCRQAGDADFRYEGSK